jgi:uncharacterized protein
MSTILHLDLRFVATGLFGGLAIGLTGMGGGAILTPVLLALGVPASTAVGSDLMASLIMKPVAGSVHASAKTVRWDIVRWLALGSVPAALVGALTSHRLTANGEANLQRAIGLTLLVAAISMIVKFVLARTRSSMAPSLDPKDDHPAVRVLPTIALGVVGGFLVGLTSVGSGSLMVVVLTLLYPRLKSVQLVGTDLVQAIPLVASAALGHVLVGSFQLGLTASLLVGGLPGAYVGARFSTGSATKYIRPALVALLVASGSKLLLV